MLALIILILILILSMLPLLERVYGNMMIYFYIRKIRKLFPIILALEMDGFLIFNPYDFSKILILENNNLRLELVRYELLSSHWDLKNIIFKNKIKALEELGVLGYKDSRNNLDASKEFIHLTLSKMFNIYNKGE